jgi:hypothetical protein
MVILEYYEFELFSNRLVLCILELVLLLHLSSHHTLSAV